MGGARRRTARSRLLASIVSLALLQPLASQCEPGAGCPVDSPNCNGGNRWRCESCVDGVTFSPGGNAICKPVAKCPVGRGVLAPPTISTNTVCEDCIAPGNFSAESSAEATCQLTGSCGLGYGLAPGTAVTASANISCATCSPGKYSAVPSRQPCEDCVANEEATQPGAAACVCAPGYFRGSTGNSSCEACEAGRYKEAGGDGGCSDCPTGTAGYALLGSAGACVHAGHGVILPSLYHAGGESYRLEAEQMCDAYLDCVAMDWTTDRISLRFSSVAEVDAIIAPGGWEKSTGGCQADCGPIAASGGSLAGSGCWIKMPVAGSSSLDDCLCPPGSSGLASTGCKLCPAGRYKAMAGAVASATAGLSGCGACHAGSVTDTLSQPGASSCARCELGQYSEHSHIACSECSEQSVYEDDEGLGRGMPQPDQCPCPPGRHLRRILSPLERLNNNRGNSARGTTPDVSSALRIMRRFPHSTGSNRYPASDYPGSITTVMAASEEDLFPLDSIKPWTNPHSYNSLPPYGRLPGDEDFPRYVCEACPVSRYSDGQDSLQGITQENQPLSTDAHPGGECHSCPMHSVTFAIGAADIQHCKCIAKGYDNAIMPQPPPLPAPCAYDPAYQ